MDLSHQKSLLASSQVAINLRSTVIRVSSSFIFLFADVHAFTTSSKLALTQGTIRPCSPCLRNAATSGVNIQTAALVTERDLQSNRPGRRRGNQKGGRSRGFNLRVLLITSNDDTMYDVHSTLLLQGHIVVEANSIKNAKVVMRDALLNRSNFEVIMIGRRAVANDESAADVAEGMRVTGFDGIIIEMRNSPPDIEEFSVFKQRGGDAFLLQPFSLQTFSEAIAGNSIMRS